MRRLMPGTVLTAILCLLGFSHASPIPLEQLVPQEDPPSFAASTNLFIRDNSIVASRANEGENSMTHDLREHGTASLDDNTDPTKRVSSTHGLPSAKRAKLVLPSLRPSQRKIPAANVDFDLPALEPQPAQSNTQADVADVETPRETEIPSDLTGEQAKVVLQILDSDTADDRLPWNTREPYRWSSQTKVNAIRIYGHGLPANPEEETALNAKLKELWTLILQQREENAKKRVNRVKNARKQLIEGSIIPQKRPSLLVQAIEEGKEPWAAASNWEAAERKEKWDDHDWKWTKADLKEVLAYIMAHEARSARRDFTLLEHNVTARNELKDIAFEEFKRMIQSDWK
ncbi:hypothetical protein H0H93_006348, partial [Arthromyces matolae]